MSVSESQFKKPMMHCPEVAMLKRASEQTMMEELGLDDDDLQHQTSSSDSDGEGDQMTQSHIHSVFPGHHEITELKQLLKITQRKLYLAQSNLSECEQNRERKLKILRKTHQSALAQKQALILELQDVIIEKEEIIIGLKAKLCNSQCDIELESKKGLQGVIEQFTHLQNEHTTLLEHYEHLSEELKDSASENWRLKEELLKKDFPIRSNDTATKCTKSQLSEQLRDLQRKVAQLEQEKRYTLSHMEKQKDLQIQISQLESQLSASQLELKRLKLEEKKTTDTIVMLKSENESLEKEVAKKESEISMLKMSMKKETDTVGSLEQKLRMEQDKVTCISNECSEVKINLQLSDEKVGHLLSVVREFETQIEKRERDNQELRQQLHVQGIQLMESKKVEGKDHLRKIRNLFSEVSISVCGINEVVASVRNLIVDFVKTLQSDLSSVTRKVCWKISALNEQYLNLVTKYKHEMALRKKLHNQVVDLKGNIRVFCRIRPVIPEDGGPVRSPASVVVETDADDDGLLDVFYRDAWRRFEMDKVFGPSSSQKQVFSEVKELVTSCADGYNVCIFAYGQTGSGKTYTMEGTQDDPGINQRALLELFDIVDQRRVDWDYSIVVSVLEVYNESVRDLLSVNFSEKMNIKQGSAGVYVPDLTQVSVTCFEEINEVFALGHKNRSTGATKLNIHSSRSHALLCITIMGLCKTTGVQTTGKLNLVDLAGSERVAKSGSSGDRLQEAKHINKSLSALGDVIYSLKSRSAYTPYRNSKLTHLLQDSLSGDSKTLMVVQIAPVEKNISETVCSLKFAERVRAVELGPASKHVCSVAFDKQ